MRYELYYWPGIQGRGEFIRLALEEAGADYIDVARASERDGGGMRALTRFLEDASVKRPPFAPPFLKAGKLVIGQTASFLPSIQEATPWFSSMNHTCESSEPANTCFNGKNLWRDHRPVASRPRPLLQSRHHERRTACPGGIPMKGTGNLIFGLGLLGLVILAAVILGGAGLLVWMFSRKIYS